jgi:acyl carrier protein
MAQVTRLNLDCPPHLAGPAKAPLTGDDAQLRETLKYCAPSTFEAACEFRKTARPEYLPAIVLGIIGRYVEPDLRERLQQPANELRLREDLGLDSLMLMEIVIRVEDVLQISIRDDELRQFRTLGEVRELIERAVADNGAPALPPVSARP